MATYDPAVIQRFADRLYRQASSMIVQYAMFLGLMGAVGGWVLGTAVKDLGGVGWLFGLGGLAFGAAVGWQRAETMRLQAQTALCQLQIEANTRRG